MGISIVDVAKAAGVSNMTVSRVLSRSRGVRPENVAAVIAAVEELGYKAPLRKRGPKPKAGARKKVKRSLLAIPSIPSAEIDPFRVFLESPFGRDVAAGIHRAADDHGIQIDVTPVVPGGQPIDTEGADGIVLIFAGVDDPAMVLAGVDAGFPCVMLPQRLMPRRPAWDSVTVSTNMMGELIVEKLLEYGCSSLALVSNLPRQEMPRDLIYAFKDEARHNDVANYYVGPRMYHAGNSDEDLVIDGSPRALVDQLLDLPRVPDGLALGVDSVSDMYDELRSRGIEPVAKEPRSGKSAVIMTPATVKLWLHPVKPQPYRIGYDGIATGERLLEQLLRRIARPDDPITELSIAPEVLE